MREDIPDENESADRWLVRVDSTNHEVDFARHVPAKDGWSIKVDGVLVASVNSWFEPDPCLFKVGNADAKLVMAGKRRKLYVGGVPIPPTNAAVESLNETLGPPPLKPEAETGSAAVTLLEPVSARPRVIVGLIATGCALATMAILEMNFDPTVPLRGQYVLLGLSIWMLFLATRAVMASRIVLALPFKVAGPWVLLDKRSDLVATTLYGVGIGCFFVRYFAE